MEVFSAEASRALHRITQGIPREINVVAGLAMLSAYTEDAAEVGLPHVVSVVREYGYEGLGPEDAVRNPLAHGDRCLTAFPFLGCAFQVAHLRPLKVPHSGLPLTVLSLIIVRRRDA